MLNVPEAWTLQKLEKNKLRALKDGVGANYEDVLKRLDDEDQFRFPFAVVKLTGLNISLEETVC